MLMSPHANRSLYEGSPAGRKNVVREGSMLSQASLIPSQPTSDRKHYNQQRQDDARGRARSPLVSSGTLGPPPKSNFDVEGVTKMPHKWPKSTPMAPMAQSRGQSGEPLLKISSPQPDAGYHAGPSLNMADILELVQAEVEVKMKGYRSEIARLTEKVARLEEARGNTDTTETKLNNNNTGLTENGIPLSARTASENDRLIREISLVNVEWSNTWLEQAENGELDIYTCLGLSNCFTFTPDTRNIIFRAIAVTVLQMLVPFFLLTSEITNGIDLGPAEGALGFRMVGTSLYGYAIYNLYNGAKDGCRTELLNLCFAYPNVSAGHWLPLVIGEVSNVFTAVVLVVALYSIFTTQTMPADLILNAVAINFLGDVDAGFVDTEMKRAALADFRELTQELFTGQRSARSDPKTQTYLAKVMALLLQAVTVAGALGCVCFLLHPVHIGGERDTSPGFSHHVQNS